MFKFITHRPLWANILAAIIIALIIFFIFIFSLNWLTNHNKSKSVPYVVGKTFDEASSILDKAGFEIQIQDSIYLDTAKPLAVLKQVPEADELVKENRTVYLTINRFVPPLIEMPNIVGYTFRSAEMALKNSNLRVGDTSYKADFARNTVLEQRYNGTLIKPGDKVRMGSSIDLVLGTGTGDRKFIVPNLVGLTFCEAKAILASQGIGFGSVMSTGVSDTCNSFIYQQSPTRYNDERKFQYIRPGQMIDIWIQVDRVERPTVDTSAIQTPDPDQE